MRRFRQACRENFYTQWLQPKQVLSKEFRDTLRPPLSWAVEVPRRGIVSTTPDATIGFAVKGSTRRILLLCVDDGLLPVTKETGDSLFLRTEALVLSIEKTRLASRLRFGRILVLWVMKNQDRLEQLKLACALQKYYRVCLVDQRTFENTENALEIRWEMPNQPTHTLI